MKWRRTGAACLETELRHIEHSLMALRVVRVYLGFASTLAQLHNLPQSLSHLHAVREAPWVWKMNKNLSSPRLGLVCEPPEAVLAPLLLSS